MNFPFTTKASLKDHAAAKHDAYTNRKSRIDSREDYRAKWGRGIIDAVAHVTRKL